MTETWSRLTSNELKRDAPVGYYLPVLLFGALPWSIVPWAGWRRIADAWRGGAGTPRFLVLWLAVPLVLFSFMHSKRPHYVLPLVPALVLLSIWIWTSTPRGDRLPGVRVAAAMWTLAGLALVGLGLGAAPHLLERIDGLPAATVAGCARTLGAAWLGAGLLGLASSRSLLRSFCALILPAVAFLLLSAPLAAAVGARRSTRELAREIDRAYATPLPGLAVVAVENFPASLPFYLERPLILVSSDGSQLRSNYVLRRYSRLAGDGEGGALRAPAWLPAAIADCSTPRVFVLRRHHDGAREQLGSTGRPTWEGGRDYVVYGPCPGRVPGDRAPAPPPEPLPLPDGEAGKVSG